MRNFLNKIYHYHNSNVNTSKTKNCHIYKNTMANVASTKGYENKRNYLNSR